MRTCPIVFEALFSGPKKLNLPLGCPFSSSPTLIQNSFETVRNLGFFSEAPRGLIHLARRLKKLTENLGKFPPCSKDAHLCRNHVALIRVPLKPPAFIETYC